MGECSGHAPGTRGVGNDSMKAVVKIDKECTQCKEQTNLCQMQNISRKIDGKDRLSFHLGVLESVYMKTQNPVLF